MATNERLTKLAHTALLTCGMMALVAAGPATQPGGDHDTGDRLVVLEPKLPPDIAQKLARVRAFQPRMRWATTDGKKEKGAYLGVTATPADATLGEQLKLPRGVGLVVDAVEDGSPAATAGIAPRDVVAKVDDQWAINAEQFGVLVRMHKPGDEVPITIIHQGETHKVTAKLVEKEMFVSTDTAAIEPMLRNGGWSTSFDLKPSDLPAALKQFGADSDDNVVIQSSGRTLKIRSTDGHGSRLTVVDGNHKTVFDGPIDTPEQRMAIPPDVQSVIDKYKRQIDTATDGDGQQRRFIRIFDTAEVKADK